MATADNTVPTRGICLAYRPLRKFTPGLATERRPPERSANSPDPAFELHSVTVADRAQIASGIHPVNDLLESTAHRRYLSEAVVKK